MPKPTTPFVGLDVHNNSITAAHAEAHRSAPRLFVGTIGGRQSTRPHVHGCERQLGSMPVSAGGLSAAWSRWLARRRWGGDSCYRCGVLGSSFARYDRIDPIREKREIDLIKL
jgi:hypothetical protein